MNPQRRFAPIGGLFKPESVAGLTRIRSLPLLFLAMTLISPNSYQH